MKIQLIIVLVTFAIVSIKAQSLEVVTSSGDFHKQSSGSLSWTLGEVTVETLIGTNHILTQGFQQNKLTVTAIDKLQIPGIEFNVYPNPTNSYLFIEVKTEKQRDLNLKLYDLNGKLILQEKFAGSHQTVSMQNYKPANYILRITEDNKEIMTYKIVKQ
jgi:hypothetical protein